MTGRAARWRCNLHRLQRPHPRPSLVPGLRLENRRDASLVGSIKDKPESSTKVLQAANLFFQESQVRSLRSRPSQCDGTLRLYSSVGTSSDSTVLEQDYMTAAATSKSGCHLEYLGATRMLAQ